MYSPLKHRDATPSTSQSGNSIMVPPMGNGYIIKSATVDRENASHEAFAKYRTHDFHYVESRDYFNIMDAYCTVEEFSLHRPPLVVLGKACSGKSALLANWAQQRKLTARNESSCIIFQHYVGATYDSVNLSLFLFRLMHKLKHACGLKDFELPHEHEEEKLKFSLVRCLEAATQARGTTSERRNIIVLVDGIDSLRTSEGRQSLTWMPNDMPLGVKFIVSATTLVQVKTTPSCRYIIREKYMYDSDDDIVMPDVVLHDTHDTPITKELRRRKCSFFHIEPLDENLCGKILEHNATRAGWTFSKKELNTILDAQGSSCPMYIRLILHSLSILAPTMDKLASLERLLQATDAGQLYLNVLQEWNQLLCPESSTKSTPPHLALLGRHAISLFAVTRYGLSLVDFHNLLEDSASTQVREQLWTLMRPHLMQVDRDDCEEVIYELSNNPLRVMVKHAFLTDDQLLTNYHKELVAYLTSIPACQRRLDELPVHLEFCGLWSALQSALVDINMFLLWWTEKNCEDFIALWIVVRNHSGAGHDPVDEYIRALDEFVDGHPSEHMALLDLLVKITNFFRRWQRHDHELRKPDLRRPRGPEVRDLLTCHGAFSPLDTSATGIHELLQVFSPQESDGYFVKRWLWSQYPLLAIAFEDHYLAPIFASAEIIDITSMLGIKKAPVVESSMKSPKAKKDKHGKKDKSSLPDGHPLLPSPFDAKKTNGNNARPSTVKGMMKSSSTASIAPNNANNNARGANFEFLNGDQDESRITASNLREQIRELRAEHDKLAFDVKAKQGAISKLNSKLLDVKAEESQRSAGAQKLDDILNQMQEAVRVQAEGKQRSRYYRLILRQCELMPGRDPNIIEVAETQVRHMRQEIIDLHQRAQVLGYECKLSRIEIPKLQAAIAEQGEMHKQALYRLKWRHVQNIRQHQWELEFRLESVSMRRQAQGDLGAEGETEMVNKMNDRLMQRKQALDRKRGVKTVLQFYTGSELNMGQDPGLLQILREAGIHSAKEVLPRWHDMYIHRDQLREEKRQAEEKNADYRAQIASLHMDLENLKFGVAKTVTKQHGSVNLKDIEAKIALAQRGMILKKERTSHLESLFENLALGLSHIAKLLSPDEVKSESTAIDMINQVEQGVRKLIGEETQMSNSSSQQLRRSSLLKQTKDGQTKKEKTAEEKALLNRRVQIKVPLDKLAQEWLDDSENGEDDDSMDDDEDMETIENLRKEIKESAHIMVKKNEPLAPKPTKVVPPQ